MGVDCPSAFALGVAALHVSSADAAENIFIRFVAQFNLTVSQPWNWSRFT